MTGLQWAALVVIALSGVLRAIAWRLDGHPRDLYHAVLCVPWALAIAATPWSSGIGLPITWVCIVAFAAGYVMWPPDWWLRRRPRREVTR